MKKVLNIKLIFYYQKSVLIFRLKKWKRTYKK